ncbi:hypothetical protein Pcinc_003147 [Petrolisthes cinctipes]|uniref:Uncharacterized protein n=1 Tax=Petrolisthes cinctipes TaxID=88211 RepID=A0AAE1GP12_PETCI|nr:hypothetical protein Pcinc_003147 [Petrolisthes cinctipes]
MPPAIKLYLEEKEPSDIHNAAILAENYVLTHKGGSFPTVTRAGGIGHVARNCASKRQTSESAGEGVVQCMFRPNCEDITVGEQCLNGSGIAGGAECFKHFMSRGKSEDRHFVERDKVLLLLPTYKTPLQAKYEGPYEVARRCGSDRYIIKTPGRRKTERRVHANNMKLFQQRPVVMSVQAKISRESEEDHFMPMSPSLNNSVILANPESLLQHLETDGGEGITTLLSKFPSVFGDVPQQSVVASHDVVLGYINSGFCKIFSQYLVVCDCIEVHECPALFTDLSFHGERINVTALPYEPYWMSADEGNATKYSGIDYKQLATIANALNFTFQVLPSHNWNEVRQGQSSSRWIVAGEGRGVDAKRRRVEQLHLLNHNTKHQSRWSSPSDTVLRIQGIGGNQSL